MLMFLKTLVLPIIEYSCVLWNPNEQSFINEIENMQSHIKNQ